MCTTNFRDVLNSFHSGTFQVLDDTIPLEDYISIDLSVTNKALTKVDMSNPYEMDSYILDYLKGKKGKVAYGGYNEKRNLYKSSTIFDNHSSEARSVHLGVDFWAAEGTAIRAPLPGKIHSYKDNATSGDYGPTIILEHFFQDIQFYTLYGHLSKSSLENIYIGKNIALGAVFANLGTPEENVNYAPHLHFQIIKDLQGFSGDYPGVCSEKERAAYLKNCPDPNLLLKFK